MPILTLPQGSLVTLGGVQLSEQTRSSFQIATEAKKNDIELADGSRRRYFVASKDKFTFSWSWLPSVDSKTLDGKAGRNSLRSLYDNNMGNALTLIYKSLDSNNLPITVTKTVFIDTYSETLLKRYGTYFWECSLSLVEI